MLFCLKLLFRQTAVIGILIKDMPLMMIKLLPSKVIPYSSSRLINIIFLEAKT